MHLSIALEKFGVENMTDLIGKVFVTEGKYTSKAKKHKEGYTMTRRALGRSESGLLRYPRLWRNLALLFLPCEECRFLL